MTTHRLREMLTTDMLPRFHLVCAFSTSRLIDELKQPVEISVGSFYDPHLLPGYGGAMFRLVNAKLVQRDIVDCNGDPIAPWRVHDKLCPETLVLMKVQLLTFELPDRQNDGVRKVRHIVHLATLIS